jgi:hypothetical protein
VVARRQEAEVPYSQRKRTTAKSVLRLPDLEHAKAAVLNSLTSPDAQRGDRHAIDEFVDRYRSEPRLALNRFVVLRYRSHLESRQLAPSTVNLRLGRVKGVKKLGVRLGNWLTRSRAKLSGKHPIIDD